MGFAWMRMSEQKMGDTHPEEEKSMRDVQEQEQREPSQSLHEDRLDVNPPQDNERIVVEEKNRREKGEASHAEDRRNEDNEGGSVEDAASREETEEYAYELKIPHERIAVLIGRKGGVKKRIEEELGVRVEIDSREGDIRVSGRDPLKLYTAREIIRAIARGFSPEHAFELLKQDYVLDVIPITDYARTRNALVRLRGRVIGERGRSRRTIEQMTGTWLSVYGKTVGIIGRVEDVSMARRAVEMLLGQAQHAPVYKMLEKYRAEQRRREALWLREEDELREALRDEFREDMNAE